MFITTYDICKYQGIAISILIQNEFARRDSISSDKIWTIVFFFCAKMKLFNEIETAINATDIKNMTIYKMFIS